MQKNCTHNYARPLPLTLFQIWAAGASRVGRNNGFSNAASAGGSVKWEPFGSRRTDTKVSEIGRKVLFFNLLLILESKSPWTFQNCIVPFNATDILHSSTKAHPKPPRKIKSSCKICVSNESLVKFSLTFLANLPETKGLSLRKTHVNNSINLEEMYLFYCFHLSPLIHSPYAVFQLP